jgi:hypothetical protein
MAADRHHDIMTNYWTTGEWRRHISLAKPFVIRENDVGDWYFRPTKNQTTTPAAIAHDLLWENCVNVQSQQPVAR